MCINAQKLHAIINLSEKIAKIDKFQITKIQKINALGGYMKTHG